MQEETGYKHLCDNCKEVTYHEYGDYKRQYKESRLQLMLICKKCKEKCLIVVEEK